ncbi:hypothetical protein HUK84_08075 [Nguyenibacter vanlangensis]|uniref:Uncharacterized protein n=1 Tax=Nguyenibacter vanlangensis TaxID=1216886 RepID=A0A7Y7M4Q4_9PROT|nr:hypothetical protein [Nguyenibacter vanlangensis]
MSDILSDPGANDAPPTFLASIDCALMVVGTPPIATSSDKLTMDMSLSISGAAVF